MRQSSAIWLYFCSHTSPLFCSHYLCDASSSPVGVKWNPLHYWKIHGSTFSRLGKLARRVLCATATTAGVERIFSTAGFIVSCRRARIGDNLFESLLFNNFNSDLRVFSGTMAKFASGQTRKCRKMKLNKTVLSAVSFCQIKNGRLKWDELGIVLQTGKWDISKPFREMDGKWTE